MAALAELFTEDIEYQNSPSGPVNASTTGPMR